MSHESARKALAAGTPPELVCSTCPWDRNCVDPPSVSSADVEKTMQEAKAMDIANGSGGTSTLIAAMAMAGRDTAGQLCPVFALRLRGPSGRQVADVLRSAMSGWEDPQ